MRAALLALLRAFLSAVLVVTLNGSQELGGTRPAEALRTAIRCAAVRSCEVPVAKAWSSLLVGACSSLVQFLMEPVAIRCVLQEYEIPHAEFDVFLSPAGSRPLTMNVAPEQFSPHLLSDLSRCALRRQIQPVWPSRACAGVHH